MKGYFVLYERCKPHTRLVQYVGQFFSARQIDRDPYLGIFTADVREAGDIAYLERVANEENTVYLLKFTDIKPIKTPFIIGYGDENGDGETLIQVPPAGWVGCLRTDSILVGLTKKQWSDLQNKGEVSFLTRYLPEGVDVEWEEPGSLMA